MAQDPPNPAARRLVEASQTLGAAYLDGYRPRARCKRGSRIGPVKVERCGYEADLDLETLLWKCGAAYPSYRLARFLKCPRCGGAAIEVTWHQGARPAPAEYQKLYQCHQAAGR